MIIPSYPSRLGNFGAGCGLRKRKGIPGTMPRERSQHLLTRNKMNRPQLPAGLIVRPRLLERLDEASARRVFLISAPAGYGKTTLAVQWLERCPSKIAWISLYPDRFSRHFVSSMQTALAGHSPHDFLLECGIIGGGNPPQSKRNSRYSLIS